jgi:hypothetical protein
MGDGDLLGGLIGGAIALTVADRILAPRYRPYYPRRKVIRRKRRRK